MPVKAKPLQLTIECAEIENPVNDIKKPVRKASVGRPVPSRRTPNPQAFLPGFSRRGRPRSIESFSPAQRAALSRQRRLEQGGKRLEFILDSDSVAKLDLLADHLKEPRSEVLIGLIAKAAARLLRK